MKRKTNKQKTIYHLIPLKWSLYYIMTKKEWQDFRSRVKAANLDWERCSCPKGCLTKALDEQWNYDNCKHIKRFKKAEFICNGCHWLKTPQLRIKTWVKDELGLLPPPSKTPHIYECLGWTKEEVRKLRENDLKEEDQQIKGIEKIKKEVAVGKAKVISWDIDLSAIKQYGYSELEIALYELEFRSKARNVKFE